MMSYFVLTLMIATLNGNATIPVGLQYETRTACEQDVKRAAGMLERIMDARYGDGSSHVYAHSCARGV